MVSLGPGGGLLFTLTILSYSLCTTAYIPALPSNTSSPSPASASAQLHLQRFGDTYAENVTYELVGANSTGVSKVRVPI
ncbi:hypothetical protein BDW22DRAFT_1360787 [Trametopsis cervina]|nr:hypothetical protein BDW22DRAFT_1360787 [Trametopsis cervina]